MIRSKLKALINDYFGKKLYLFKEKVVEPLEKNLRWHPLSGFRISLLLLWQLFNMSKKSLKHKNRGMIIPCSSINPELTGPLEGM